MSRVPRPRSLRRPGQRSVAADLTAGVRPAAPGPASHNRLSIDLTGAKRGRSALPPAALDHAAHIGLPRLRSEAAQDPGRTRGLPRARVLPGRRVDDDVEGACGIGCTKRKHLLNERRERVGVGKLDREQAVPAGGTTQRRPLNHE